MVFKIFQKLFTAGFWKGFQILLLISKEQAKSLSLIFLTTKQQKIVNVNGFSACTESTYLLLYKPSKIIFISRHNPFSLVKILCWNFLNNLLYGGQVQSRNIGVVLRREHRAYLKL
jgi:uncharacterized SAM-binding protein YcdF (DUF218 family)